MEPGQLCEDIRPGWRRVLPVAMLGVLVATVLVGARAGLPDGFDPTAPFTVGERTGIDQQLRERDVPLADAVPDYGTLSIV